MPTNMANHRDLEIEEVINIISLIRLIVGGAAILAAMYINQKNEIVGLIDRIPLVKNILRVLVDS
jgi:hypothetical protein